MACLGERWHGGEGKSIGSCTIIITDANHFGREIHGGMPVILGWESYDAWPDPDNQDANTLLALLKPADPARWTTHPVSRHVDSPRNDGPERLEPVDSKG